MQTRPAAVARSSLAKMGSTAGERRGTRRNLTTDTPDDKLTAGPEAWTVLDPVVAHRMQHRRSPLVRDSTIPSMTGRRAKGNQGTRPVCCFRRGREKVHWAEICGSAELVFYPKVHQPWVIYSKLIVHWKLHIMDLKAKNQLYQPPS
jgi:hypothetical protein